MLVHIMIMALDSIFNYLPFFFFYMPFEITGQSLSKIRGFALLNATYSVILSMKHSLLFDAHKHETPAKWKNNGRVANVHIEI